MIRSKARAQSRRTAVRIETLEARNAPSDLGVVPDFNPQPDPPTGLADDANERAIIAIRQVESTQLGGNGLGFREGRAFLIVLHQ
jgi:hypothetical protein